MVDVSSPVVTQRDRGDTRGVAVNLLTPGGRPRVVWVLQGDGEGDGLCSPRQPCCPHAGDGASPAQPKRRGPTCSAEGSLASPRSQEVDQAGFVSSNTSFLPCPTTQGPCVVVPSALCPGEVPEGMGTFREERTSLRKLSLFSGISLFVRSEWERESAGTGCSRH